MDPLFQMTDAHFKRFVVDALIDFLAQLHVLSDLVLRDYAERTSTSEKLLQGDLTKAKEKYRADLAAHFLTRHSS